jgi:hypothetical protein
MIYNKFIEKRAGKTYESVVDVGESEAKNIIETLSEEQKINLYFLIQDLEQTPELFQLYPETNCIDA